MKKLKYKKFDFVAGSRSRSGSKPLSKSWSGGGRFWSGDGVWVWSRSGSKV